MREGGYVRYDGRKSTQVLRDCEMLIADYGGRLSRLHDAARDARDLEERLLAFYGVGPVTMNIFLRELRPFWARRIPLRCRPSKDWRNVSRSISSVTAGKAWCSPGSKPASFDDAVSLQQHRLLLVEAAEPAGLRRKVRCSLDHRIEGRRDA